QDGHSHLLASTIPNCVSYDPTFAYELAVIVHDGLKRMFERQESVFYYITVMNENYVHPALPAGAEEGIVKGLYKLQERNAAQIQLLGSGTILREVIAAGELLEAEFGVAANVWSATSMNELRRDGLACARWNMLHPEAEPHKPWITRQLEGETGPVVAATDYLKSYADQVREFVPARYRVLGTDGFGRSDSRKKLREFFEVNRHFIVVAALKALADEGAIAASKVTEAMTRYGIDPEKPNPLAV
ncbi:MAG: pyruvate dehydrogenase (acetyl-transferring), homodimeric type, partial [Gammaproteobacteria bacterium]|nr:pyruvate dehydrogenase (acetyl-transferring), homodimeric type [Gammaproteobacteria bacterium]